MYVNNKFPPTTTQYDDNDKKGNRTPTTPQSLPPQTPPPQSPPCATTTNGDDNDQAWAIHAEQQQPASKNQGSKCPSGCKNCYPDLPSPEPEPESKSTDESDHEWEAVTDSGTFENSQNSEEGPKEES